MSFSLLIAFLLVVTAIVITAISQRRSGEEDDVKMHFSRREREALAQQMEDVEIQGVPRWEEIERRKQEAVAAAEVEKAAASTTAETQEEDLLKGWPRS